MSVTAQSARSGRATGAQWLPNDRATTGPAARAAQSAPNERAIAAQSARNGRAVSAQSVPNDCPTAAQSGVDGESVDAFLEALAELGDGRPVFGGREMSRADARSVLEAAAAAGNPLDLVLAEVMALEEEFRRKGRGMGSPVALLRHWVARPDLSEHVPFSLRREAREILGLKPEEQGKDEAEPRVDIEIVGEPPYEPQVVWEKARERLREELGRRDFNTWLRDNVLLAWDEGEFVIGVPNAFAKEWLQSRLNGTVTKALSHAAEVSEEEVSVRYVIHVR